MGQLAALRDQLAQRLGCRSKQPRIHGVGPASTQGFVNGKGNANVIRVLRLEQAWGLVWQAAGKPAKDHRRFRFPSSGLRLAE
jgi:hypothetical protein